MATRKLSKIWIDGRPFDADPGKNLLEVCLSLGINLPYFCWHPALGSVGACRQCAVKQLKDENDQQGRIVMACMTPASDGTRIAVEDAEVRAFRAQVIEWLMVNHPHDCPVCDEGGECHLQDMTVMTGHVYRRFRFPKRTYLNQDLGPLVNHEMNRCIHCYRCVRYYRDYAGGLDLQEQRAHDEVYFGRHHHGTLESPFAGNLVEVCPTGVFTDKTLGRHYTRKWDLQTAPSLCVHCGVGCNTIPGERYGELRRVRNRYNGAVNRHFLCDRGRYGYEFVNHQRRLRDPLLPHGSQRPASPLEGGEALQRLAALLAPGRRLLGIGSPRASLESNFVLRSLVGEDRFHLGVSAAEARLLRRTLELYRGGALRAPTLAEVSRCDAVLVLGEDPIHTAPVLGLALRQAARQQPLREAAALGIPAWHDAARREVMQSSAGPLYLATPMASELDAAARRSYRGSPLDCARLGFAVAHALDPVSPVVPELGEEARGLTDEIGGALRQAQRPLLVTGLSLGEPALLEAAVNLAQALGRARGGASAELCVVVPEANSLGLALLGGRDLEHAFDAVDRNEAEAVIVVENDLFRRAPGSEVERFLGKAPHLCVLDHHAHETGARAELLLPAATYAESDGTLVNLEGRAQRFFQVMQAQGAVRASWRWLAEAARQAGRQEAAAWVDLDGVLGSLAVAHPELAGAGSAAPPASYRLDGQAVSRQPLRWSGRTAVMAHRQVHEARPPADPDAPLAFSMEGADSYSASVTGQLPSALVPRFWAPGWNSDQALHRFQEEVEGPLRGGDPGVRLLEPRAGAALSYQMEVPIAAATAGRWRCIPIHHIFGSEELSALAPGVAALAPAAYLALAPTDAEQLGLGEGEEAVVEVDGGRWRLPVRLRAELSPGLAGVPVGLFGQYVAAGPIAIRPEAAR